jgi:hypothetical protein
LTKGTLTYDISANFDYVRTGNERSTFFPSEHAKLYRTNQSHSMHTKEGKASVTKTYMACASASYRTRNKSTGTLILVSYLPLTVHLGSRHSSCSRRLLFHLPSRSWSHTLESPAPPFPPTTSCITASRTRYGIGPCASSYSSSSSTVGSGYGLIGRSETSLAAHLGYPTG